MKKHNCKFVLQSRFGACAVAFYACWKSTTSVKWHSQYSPFLFRGKPVFAKCPQEHDVQTAAASWQALGHSSAQHLGWKCETGMSLCCLITPTRDLLQHKTFICLQLQIWWSTIILFLSSTVYNGPLKTLVCVNVFLFTLINNLFASLCSVHWGLYNSLEINVSYFPSLKTITATVPLI